MIIKSLNEVIEKLDFIGIPYMLCGSVAMTYYTVTRSTRDIDFVIYLKASQIDQMEEIFKGDYFDKDSVKIEVGKKGMFNVIISSTGFKIDFMLLKDDPYSIEAFSRRRLVNDFVNPVYVTSLEDLIIAKIMWIQEIFSDRHYTDLENLLLNNHPDKNYLNYWIKKMKLNTFKLFENE